jgi:hypothetical protein
MIKWLCFSFFLFTLGCTLWSNVNGGTSLEPVRILKVKIEQSQRQELFDQLQKFADKHDAKFVFSDYGTTDHFLIEIWAEEVLITASDDPGTSRGVSVFFSGRHPAAQVDEESIAELQIDLKSFINEIPNVMITEE